MHVVWANNIAQAKKKKKVKRKYQENGTEVCGMLQVRILY